MITSISSTSNCDDNAKAERLFRIIEYEWFFTNSFETMDGLVVSLTRSMDCYNHKRSHAALGYITPAQFELQKRIAAPANGRKNFGIGIAATLGEHYRY